MWSEETERRVAGMIERVIAEAGESGVRNRKRSTELEARLGVIQLPTKRFQAQVEPEDFYDLLVLLRDHSDLVTHNAEGDDSRDVIFALPGSEKRRVRTRDEFLVTEKMRTTTIEKCRLDQAQLRNSSAASGYDVRIALSRETLVDPQDIPFVVPKTEEVRMRTRWTFEHGEGAVKYELSMIFRGNDSSGAESGIMLHPHSPDSLEIEIEFDPLHPFYARQGFTSLQLARSFLSKISDLLGPQSNLVLCQP